MNIIIDSEFVLGIKTHQLFNISCFMLFEATPLVLICLLKVVEPSLQQQLNGVNLYNYEEKV